MSDLIERDKVMKVAMWFGTSEQKYAHSFIKKRVMEIPSARPNNRGICGVCAGRKVCGKNNRNLDMLECSIFELDEHYKISRPKGKWLSDDGHVCSNCGKYAVYNASLEEQLTNFCPNCGADMRGDNHD